MLRSFFNQLSSASVLGMNRRNLELILPRNPRKHFPIADDKLLTKKVLSNAGIPVAPTLATFGSFYEIGQWKEKIADLNDFVIKPARGSGGRGILVVDKRSGDRFFTPGDHCLSSNEITRHIADIVFGVYAFDKADVAIVEPRLRPENLFSKLYPDGLSDMRLILADEILDLCMLRIPTRASDGRANLHQGAIGIGVDVKTGRTYRAWGNGREITTHPETGIPLIGHIIPQWKEIVQIGQETSKVLPLKFLGVDMVVDETLGPMVLEVNVRPGIEIQNVTGISMLKNLRRKGVLR